jgi:hypothetical protein
VGWGSIGAAVGRLAFVALAFWLFGNAREHAGKMEERAAWEKIAAARERQLGDRRVADERRHGAALARYLEGRAAIEPLIIHSRDTVTTYAQSPAGRAPCRDAERVHGIDALDAALFDFTPPAAGGGAGAVPADAAAPPG